MEDFEKVLGFKSDDDKASALQRSVRRDEADNLASGLDKYPKEQAIQAIVHMREDVVLLVSHLSSMNEKQNKVIQRLNFLIVLLLIIISSIFLM